MNKENAAAFNTALRAIIVRLEQKSRSDVEIANLDRLRKRISLLRNSIGDTVLIRAATPFFVGFGEKIVARDEEFFLNMDVRQKYLETQSHISKQDEFMFTLIESVQNNYKRAEQKEKDLLYSHIQDMLVAALKFNGAT